MADKIESYNSSYPLSFYKIGAVYAFYMQPLSENRKRKPASVEQVRQYGLLLQKMDSRQHSTAIKPITGDSTISGKSKMQRCYAVVVGKNSGAFPTIQVMFIARINGRDEFELKTYAVGSKGCTTDGKNLMAASRSVDGAKVTPLRKSGGVTLDEGVSKRGGITLDEGTTGFAMAHSVGTITLDEDVAQNAVHKQKIEAQQLPQQSARKKIGGITLDEN